MPAFETVQAAINAGQLVLLLEDVNPGDDEEIHALFVGGAHTPARVRCFVDYLADQLKHSIPGTGNQNT